MSFTLGIDTTGAAGGLAILSGETLVGSRDLGLPGGQAERILVDLDGLLHDLSLSPEDLELVAVACGPGSFTGVRIGMAAAQGLAFSLGRPMVGVTSLEVLAAWAYEVTEGECDILVPLIDARRGEVYAAVCAPAGGAFVARAEPVAIAPGGVTAFAEAGAGQDPASRIVFCGDGVPIVAAELAARGRPFKTVFPPRAGDRARMTAALGIRRFLAQGADTDLEPLYIREADARKPARPQGAAADLFPVDGESTGGEDAP